jgi:hypothetical protein
MNRTDIFSFRVSAAERQTIAELAARLDRKQSDAVRFLVMQAARQLLDAAADSGHMHETEGNRNGQYARE